MNSDVEQKLRELKEQGNDTIAPELEDVIKDIAKTGRYMMQIIPCKSQTGGQSVKCSGTEMLKEHHRERQKLKNLENDLVNSRWTRSFICSSQYSWELLKPLFAIELKQVMEHFLENFPPKNSEGTDTDEVKELQSLKNNILKTFNGFTSAPFTIQRLSELITQPRKHYKACSKFYHGVLRNILVVSTVEPDITKESPLKKIKLHENGESSINLVSTLESCVEQTDAGKDEQNTKKYDEVAQGNLPDLKIEPGDYNQNSSSNVEAQKTNSLEICTVIRRTENDKIDTTTDGTELQATGATDNEKDAQNDSENDAPKEDQHLKTTEVETVESLNVGDSPQQQQVEKDKATVLLEGSTTDQQENKDTESGEQQVKESKHEPMDQS